MERYDEDRIRPSDIKCSLPRCRRPHTIGYLGVKICEYHWDTMESRDLKKALNHLREFVRLATIDDPKE